MNVREGPSSRCGLASEATEALGPGIWWGGAEDFKKPVVALSGSSPNLRRAI